MALEQKRNGPRECDENLEPVGDDEGVQEEFAREDAMQRSSWQVQVHRTRQQNAKKGGCEDSKPSTL